jgi:hypothetical protein
VAHNGAALLGRVIQQNEKREKLISQVLQVRTNLRLLVFVLVVFSFFAKVSTNWRGLVSPLGHGTIANHCRLLARLRRC